MSHDKICPQCEQPTLVEQTMDSSVVVNGEERPVRGLEYFLCQNCGAEPVFSDQAKRNDLRFADARREALGLLTSGEIAAARGKHGLTQAACSRLLGGGANSFNKYESGAVTQSEPMDILMRLIRDVPGALTYVAQLKGVTGITEHHVRPEAAWQLIGGRTHEIVAIGGEHFGIRATGADHNVVEADSPFERRWQAR